ncbi:DUF302 domain-containing protein [Dinghuibacter silviterrae]|uniref:Uncharacterized protein (DUF302 family) n=1 Tax=Dinghuibacter silviterrae TaxID=1539049 RepID=A0A4R8DJ37_9BACT|nr:DUF302 domain-containing protein [Dinghuibacter silviterrae]TDW97020.1 uncharacterized protein (DUF302 family) [Dinghuibacter silviterrae]
MSTEYSARGIVRRKSPHSVKESLDRFQELLAVKGIGVFARIDQQAEARKAGLDLRPTELLVFGNPKAGTPLMEAFPLSALDLPLKLLAWEEEGEVWLAYNEPSYLQERYGLTEEMGRKIDFSSMVQLVTGT